MLASLEANSSFLTELNKNFNLNQTLQLPEGEREEFKSIY